MKSKTKVNNILFYVAIAAMILLVYSFSFLSFGTLLQKSLILTGAFVLFLVALFGKQKVLQALQLVLVTGAIIGFFILSMLYALVIMLFVAALMVIYLYSIGHYKKEPVGVIGSFGFCFFALGLAFNTGSTPLIAGLFLILGAFVIAAYSALAFYLYKNRLQLVWIVLNLALSAGPILLVLSLY